VLGVKEDKHLTLLKSSRCGYRQLGEEKSLLTYYSNQPCWFCHHCQEHKRKIAIEKKLKVKKLDLKKPFYPALKKTLLFLLLLLPLHGSVETKLFS
jgi:hypothetical protein